MASTAVLPTSAHEAAPAVTATSRSRAVRRLAIGSLAAIGSALAASACTPQDIARVAIQQQFGSLSATATQIATCESGLQAGAVSPGGGNVGLFQINTVNAAWIQHDLGYRWSQLTDPFVNARVAKVMYDRSGWTPWHGTCGGRLGI